MSRAHQSRNFRRRQRDGLIVLQVTVNEADLCNVLRKAGFIGEFDADPEHAGLQALLQQVLELWITPEGAYADH
jgi:hypothetical protein